MIDKSCRHRGPYQVESMEQTLFNLPRAQHVGCYANITSTWPLHIGANNRGHEIVRAQKKVSVQRPYHDTSKIR